MTLIFILAQDGLFLFLSLLFISEAHEHEPKTSPSPRHLISHHNCVLNLAELLEVAHQVLLGRAESQTTDKELDLVLLGWLVELGRGRHHSW